MQLMNASFALTYWGELVPEHKNIEGQQLCLGQGSWKYESLRPLYENFLRALRF